MKPIEISEFADLEDHTVYLTSEEFRKMLVTIVSLNISAWILVGMLQHLLRK